MLGFTHIPHTSLYLLLQALALTLQALLGSPLEILFFLQYSDEVPPPQGNLPGSSFPLQDELGHTLTL